MATLHPFRALRPRPEFAPQIASVPYDVISAAEARRMADGNALSFLHVIRPEIDLPPNTDEHDESVYQKGAENLRAFRDSAHTVVEDDSSLYVYRLVMNGRSQSGIFGCVSVEDYDSDVILKHELTRPAKEDDRTRHILEQRAHAEPVMLTFRDDRRVGTAVEEATAGAPLYDFEAVDGVRHTIWRVDRVSALVDAFRDIPRLYVADGHHRCKAASRAAASLPRDGHETTRECDFFPAVLFPMGNMLIMPYNRIVRKLPEPPDAFLSRLGKDFDLAHTSVAAPDAPGSVCLYLDGSWYQLELPPSKRDGAASTLDVARLGEHILEPYLGITDPRRDPNVDFVGGIRGTEELVKLVDGGKAAMAISMYPTSIEQLVAVSDAGELMPPKSTWFEPKLRSGLLVHLFD